MSLLEKVKNRWTDIDISNCEKLFKDTLEIVMNKTTMNIQRFKDEFPYTGDNNKYILTDNRTWVSGYWTAWLWMCYYQSGDLRYKEAAERHYEGYNNRFNKQYIHCHDIGVIYDMAAVRGYAVTGDIKWRNLAIRASAVLATRFDEKGEFLQAWGLPGDANPFFSRTIIDSLCCIPLWFWAAEVLEDDYYSDLATKQANTILERLVRKDYSSGHTYYYDPKTKEPLTIETHQGYRDDSTWSRGQAWGIQGFPVCYAYTGDSKFLDAALKMLNYYIEELGDLIIPPWDFAVKDEERDSSSLAIAVNGMLRLAQLHEVGIEDKEACLLMAKKAMTELILKYSTMEDENAWGLLREGVYSKPANRGIGEFMIWGDYYFIENLMILAGKDPLQMEFYNRR